HELGATVVEGEPEPSLGAFPVTVDGTATPEGLVATLRLTDWGGRCTSLGQIAPSGSLPLVELYTRGVPLHLGRPMARPAPPAGTCSGLELGARAALDLLDPARAQPKAPGHLLELKLLAVEAVAPAQDGPACPGTGWGPGVSMPRRRS